MGRTYSVPRNVKGEGRILYIFSFKSIITTCLGAAVGIPIFLLFQVIGLTIPGIVAVAICALIGFGVGTLTIPDTPLVGNLRKAGGEKVTDILIRTFTFTKRKKIYIYRLKNPTKKKEDETKNVMDIFSKKVR